MNQRTKKFALSACALAASLLVAACGGGGGDDPAAPDTAAPTLAITDNIAGAKATGNGYTTFIFTFSESVGTSFTASDVTVTGGTPGVLIKVNDMKYLLEVTPPEKSSGTMSVSVAAGAYSDLSGKTNVAASAHGQDFDTVPVVPPPVGGDVVLASFEGDTASLQFTGFNGAETSTIAAGPAGGTGQAGKIIRLGGEVWAGAKVNVGVIPLTATNRTISARVYSAVAGVPMVLKLENESDAGINTGDLQATQTVVVGWQTLTWVIPADKVGPQYSWVVMLPNLGTKASDSPGETYYIDDIKLVVPPAPSDVVLASFEGDTSSLQFTGFNGAETSSIAAGPAGGTGQAGKILRLGGEVWAGAKVNVGVIPLTATNRTISARVYSAVAGVPMVLKLENETDAGINTGDLQATQTVVVGWQTLTWVIPADKVGPQYSWVVMLPNLGTKASDSPGETYYFDDIKLVVPPAPTATVLTTFEGDTSSLQFTGFNGAETSTIAAGPAGGTGQAGKIIRLGGEVWAGAKANVGVIPLTATNRTISARVYSAVAGVPMVLKLENETDAGINTGDLQATQTVVVGWQTLTWVIPADKVGPQYSWVVMLPNLGTKASDSPGETYYFDDIKLVIAPPPTATVLATFEGDASSLQFTGFNGAETSSIAAGPAGGTGLAGKILRLGGEVWAGAKVNVGVIPLTASRRTISARVHSAVAGVPMVLKLENETDAGINTGDLQATQTVVVGWQTLTWVVPAGKVGPQYSWVVMLPNLGTKASDNPGETYYFDDIKLVDGP
jgi:Bacterial Ig-like domain